MRKAPLCDTQTLMALETTDDPIHRQRMRIPVGNGLRNVTDVAERHDRHPNQYVPLLAQYPEFSDRNI